MIDTKDRRGNKRRLSLRDWGIGFPPGPVADGYYGLESIQERARLFGGQATVGTNPGCGTLVAVCLPLAGKLSRAGCVASHI